ncbi:MAG: hypothetical protein LBF60_01035 [Treponema sp.]|jgi:hypothetical protein|nr:hypothetical protein [Treponema sp.]
MKNVNRRFFPVMFALCLLGMWAMTGCSNPFFDTPGALDPYDVIAITVTPPTKRLYYWGEPLDLTGASATIHYRGPAVDSKLNQEIKSSQVSGFDSMKEGIQTAAVAIEGRSDYFDIALLAFPPGDADEMTLSQNQEKTIPNALGGSWKLYIFESASRAVVKINGKEGESGSKGEAVSFTAPPNAGAYIIAISFTKDGRAYSRFYTLTVSSSLP